MRTHFFHWCLGACAVLLCALACAHAPAQPPRDTPQTTTARVEIPAGALLQPEELQQLLRTSGGEKPLVLQVGSHVLYAEAHIPGAEYVGAAGQDAGLQALKEKVKALDRN